MQRSLTRRTIAVLAIAGWALLAAACAPPPAAVNKLDLDGFGLWTAPSATIAGTHHSLQGTGFANASITATATVAAVEEAELHFRIESSAVVPDIAVGTYTLRPWEPLQVMFINGVSLADPVMSLDGSITVTSVTYGAPTTTTGGGFTTTTRPITYLRATFSATFDAPVGLVNGSVSIG